RGHRADGVRARLLAAAARDELLLLAPDRDAPPAGDPVRHAGAGRHRAGGGGDVAAGCGVMTDVVTTLLEHARGKITRYSPAETAEAMRRGALLVDLRPTEYRGRFGGGPGGIGGCRPVLGGR